MVVIYLFLSLSLSLVRLRPHLSLGVASSAVKDSLVLIFFDALLARVTLGSAAGRLTGFRFHSSPHSCCFCFSSQSLMCFLDGFLVVDVEDDE